VVLIGTDGIVRAPVIDRALERPETAGTQRAILIDDRDLECWMHQELAML
jgi:hypothetical protein